MEIINIIAGSILVFVILMQIRKVRAQKKEINNLVNMNNELAKVATELLLERIKQETNVKKTKRNVRKS